LIHADGDSYIFYNYLIDALLDALKNTGAGYKFFD